MGLLIAVGFLLISVRRTQRLRDEYDMGDETRKDEARLRGASRLDSWPRIGRVDDKRPAHTGADLAWKSNTKP